MSLNVKHFTNILSIAGMLLSSILLLLCACDSQEAEVPDAGRSVYYWRQELRLTADEQAWMQRHKVRKMYLHLFDVERDGEGLLQPRTTLTVTDVPPREVDVIPVVFLGHRIMRDTTGLAALPRLLARRVNAMMEQNGLGEVHEVQIDFDWTRSNQMQYFVLLSKLREELDALSPTPVRLSSTIRLHQLQMPSPPVDYGSLMVYNLGKIQAETEECSILTEDLLKPYLRHLASYNLPLCIALPVYSWDLLFHDHEFSRIVRGLDLNQFEKVDETHYQAVKYMPIPPDGVSMRGDGRIFPGDIVRHEWVSPGVLKSVRRQLQDLRAPACRQIILYHLDAKQLNQYTDEDIEEIYAGS